jgi:hypothetical protein
LRWPVAAAGISAMKSGVAQIRCAETQQLIVGFALNSTPWLTQRGRVPTAFGRISLVAAPERACGLEPPVPDKGAIRQSVNFS